MKPNEKLRLQRLREARAIIAVACLHPWTTTNRTGRKLPDAPNYIGIGRMLGLNAKAADVADEMWNQANGPDEGKETEERALTRCLDTIEMELESR